MSELIPMTANQRRMLVDTRQVWDAWHAAWRRRTGYAGSLSGKEEKGSQYLVKVFDDPDTKVRKMRSLGPRSPETERVYEAFRTGKEEAKKRLESLSRKLSEQARLNRAVELGRVPVIASKILRRLDIGLGIDGERVFQRVRQDDPVWIDQKAYVSAARPVAPSLPVPPVQEPPAPPAPPVPGAPPMPA